ncbi:uncharacterized protein LOC134788029 [Penaeus indicus]|uniref:uncharacterized protein LOC134788029 n=1 Tax=Penaeus indicus TaxID=29960 RepID=UPI00300D808F
MHLYGKKQFTQVTNHKPLLNIKGPKCGLTKLVAATLQRWSVVLVAYNYVLEYRSTTYMENANALSCLPVDRAPDVQEVACVMLIDAHQPPITSQQIVSFTRKDPLLSELLQGSVSGKGTQAKVKLFVDGWGEFSVEKGCILRGARIVVPTELHKQVLEELHADHQGIVRKKSIARTFV